MSAIQCRTIHDVDCFEQVRGGFLTQKDDIEKPCLIQSILAYPCQSQAQRDITAGLLQGRGRQTHDLQPRLLLARPAAGANLLYFCIRPLVHNRSTTYMPAKRRELTSLGDNELTEYRTRNRNAPGHSVIRTYTSHEPDAGVEAQRSEDQTDCESGSSFQNTEPIATGALHNIM